MGREVRRVPADWQHPKKWNSYCGEMAHAPLFEGGRGGGYEKQAADWDEEYAKWQRGLCRCHSPGGGWQLVEEKYRNTRYTDYGGTRPSPDDYMPNWPEDQRTHYMMYEDTSEGTPISPAFATPEELARWLVDNEASAFGKSTASYEGWLAVARGGFAPSCVLENGQMKSGVEFAGESE
jgi:hypothetical protein